MEEQPRPSTTEELIRTAARIIRAVHQRVRVARTIHALPFTAVGAVLAETGWPGLGQACLLVACVVFGRATLVALVRLFAAPLDVANPGVEGRAPSDPPPAAIWSLFAVHGAVVLVFCAYLLNPLAGTLSWALLGGMVVYALLRRYTSASHLLLGVALAATPLGAWIALRGELPEDALGFGFLCGGIVAWVAGFDMVYGLYLRDHAGGEAGRFERPLAIPRRQVLIVARLVHLLAILLYTLTGPAFGLGAAWYGGAALIAALLLLAHHDLKLTPEGSTRFRRLNLATGPALLLATLVAAG